MLRNIKKKFINENGNEIELSVKAGVGNVKIVVEGPTSSVDHTWTMIEAIEIYRALHETIGHRVF